MDRMKVKKQRNRKTFLMLKHLLRSFFGKENPHHLGLEDGGSQASEQVSWLPDHPTLRTFPGSSAQWFNADFVPGHSGGPAPDSHRFPF